MQGYIEFRVQGAGFKDQTWVGGGGGAVVLRA